MRVSVAEVLVPAGSSAVRTVISTSRSVPPDRFTHSSAEGSWSLKAKTLMPVSSLARKDTKPTTMSSSSI
eukprot:2644048-Rhodomonas_salina.1